MKHHAYRTGNRYSARVVQDLVGCHTVPCHFCRLCHIRIPLLLDAQENGSRA